MTPEQLADQLSAIGSLLDEAGIPDAGSTVTRVAMLVAQRDEAVGIIRQEEVCQRGEASYNPEAHNG